LNGGKEEIIKEGSRGDMNEKELKRSIRSGDALRRVAGPLEASFWKGYCHGLSAHQRQLQGEDLVADQEHLAFLALTGEDDLARSLFGLGYRSGVDGEFPHQAEARWNALEIEDNPPPPRLGRPAGSVKRTALRGQLPAVRCDQELAVWVEQEATKMGISVGACVRLKLTDLMRASARQQAE